MSMSYILSLLAASTALGVVLSKPINVESTASDVELSEGLIKEIKSYQDIAYQITNYSISGPGADQSYKRLATFTDSFGSRLSGTQNLENAIDYMLGQLTNDNLDNVHGESALVTRWLRNTEWARLVEPRDHVMAMLGLGGSVGTPPDGILADAIVVQSFDELDQVADRVPGKIVVYNEEYVSYGVTVSYRQFGATRAAQYGAVGTLIRSITPFSLNTPHTGWQDYGDNVTKIPTACITIEDAEMLQRLQGEGKRIRIHFYMGAENFNMTTSRNTIAEIRGYKYPEQVVVVSGHLDSWDVGEGAMDDGGGAFISWQALTIVRALGLTPKRTIRLIMWTDEESGGYGGLSYYNTHRAEASNFSILFESDMGVFTPYGIQFTGGKNAAAVMGEVGNLVAHLNSSAVYPGGGGTDVGWWAPDGVPQGSIANHNEKYFWYHHSNADTMTVLNATEMNYCAAVWTVYAYVLADMEELLPRN